MTKEQLCDLSIVDMIDYVYSMATQGYRDATLDTFLINYLIKEVDAYRKEYDCE